MEFADVCKLSQQEKDEAMIGIKFLSGKNMASPVELTWLTTYTAEHLVQWWSPLTNSIYNSDNIGQEAK